MLERMTPCSSLALKCMVHFDHCINRVCGLFTDLGVKGRWVLGACTLVATGEAYRFHTANDVVCGHCVTVHTHMQATAAACMSFSHCINPAS